MGLELIAWVLNALGLTFGALLGARGLMDPTWAQKLVRLKADEQGGGFAEFRAMYGGMFLGLHAVALLLTLRWISAGGALVGVTASGAAIVIAAGWAGAAGGRLLSMLLDKTRTRFNELSVVIEAIVALAIGAPWIVWILGAAG